MSAVGTRGIYVTDAAKGYVGSYDPYTTTGRASAEGWWSFCNSQSVAARAASCGPASTIVASPRPMAGPTSARSTESSIPAASRRTTFFYYQSWWTAKPVLHLFPHWNWPGMEGKEIAVWVYSNLDKVELFCNGKSLGAKDMKKDSHWPGT